MSMAVSKYLAADAWDGNTSEPVGYFVPWFRLIHLLIFQFLLILFLWTIFVRAWFCYYTWHTVNHYSKVPSLEKMEYFNLSENCFKRKFPWQTGVKSILKCWIIQLTLICNFFSTTFCEWKCFAAGTFNSPLRYVLTDTMLPFPCFSVQSAYLCPHKIFFQSALQSLKCSKFSTYVLQVRWIVSAMFNVG